MSSVLSGQYRVAATSYPESLALAASLVHRLPCGRLKAHQLSHHPAPYMVVLWVSARTVECMFKSGAKKSRWRSLREWLSVLAGLSVVLVTFTILTGGDDKNKPSQEDSAAAAALEGFCDTATTPEYVCPTLPSSAQDSLESAQERYQSEKPDPSDVQYLLLGESEWADVLADKLGKAELIPGAAIDELLAENKLLGSAVQSATWQQEWRTDSATLVEQIFVLQTAEQARGVLAGWRDRSLQNGLTKTNAAEFLALFPKGSIGDDSFSTAFTDPTATGFFAQRRCGSLTMAAVGPALVVVTLFQGSDCENLRPVIPAGLVKVLEPRIRALLPG